MRKISHTLRNEIENKNEIGSKPSPYTTISNSLIHQPCPSKSPSVFRSHGEARSSKSSKFPPNWARPWANEWCSGEFVSLQRVRCPAGKRAEMKVEAQGRLFSSYSRPYPSPAKAVPQIGVELSKWSLTTGVRNEEREKAVQTRGCGNRVVVGKETERHNRDSWRISREGRVDADTAVGQVRSRLDSEWIRRDRGTSTSSTQSCASVRLIWG